MHAACQRFARLQNAHVLLIMDFVLGAICRGEFLIPNVEEVV